MTHPVATGLYIAAWLIVIKFVAHAVAGAYPNSEAATTFASSV